MEPLPTDCELNYNLTPLRWRLFPQIDGITPDQTERTLHQAPGLCGSVSLQVDPLVFIILAIVLVVGVYVIRAESKRRRHRDDVSSRPPFGNSSKSHTRKPK